MPADYYVLGDVRGRQEKMWLSPLKKKILLQADSQPSDVIAVVVVSRTL